MVRERLIRDGPLPTDDEVLVRTLFDVFPGGAIFDRAVLIADATVNHDAFGYYGLSLWRVSEVWTVDRIMAEKASRASRVALFRAGEFRAHGLFLVPSGKMPHFDVTGEPAGTVTEGSRAGSISAELLVDRFLAATYTVIKNPRLHRRW